MSTPESPEVSAPSPSSVHPDATLTARQQVARFKAQIDAQRPNIEVWGVFSPLFPLLARGMAEELPSVELAADVFDLAQSKFAQDPGSAAELGEALFAFTRAWQRLLRLEAVWKAEEVALRIIYPTLARLEQDRAARNGLPVEREN